MKKAVFVVTACFMAAMAQGQAYLHSLPDYAAYKAYKGKPLSDKFSNIESVKIIYDIREKEIYFFNSTLVRLHFQFVTNYLGYDKGLEQFNLDNYSNKQEGREFLLGNLNHIKGSDKWIFELASSDHMPVPMIEMFFDMVRKKTFIGEKLKFYLNNREKVDLFDQKKFKIPCITSEYIFNEIKYQEVVGGNSVGILKEYRIKDLDSIRPKPDEIILLDGTPEVLPNVKGIIVNELQTPLSHLVILGKNRKIPIMAYTKSGSDKSLKKLLGKKVELKISIDTFYIKETTKKITVKSIEKKKTLVADNTVTGLIDLSKIPENGVKYIGSKAQNMAYLIAIAKETPFKAPEDACAIPFSYYTKHIQQKAIAALIAELLSYPKKDSTQWINTQLKKIRTAIKKEAIDPGLIAKLNQKLGTQDKFRNFRFRSSTNAEDIDGFNGAGLYESKTGILNDTIKSFEKAIKQVWASAWNESSYWERELFGISQQNIAMGVLVHRSFPDEVANGVIITKNVFRENFPGITINIQKGENSVVKPKKGEICEQFTVYNFNLMSEQPKDFDVDYTSNSNLNDNKPLLTAKEINTIYKVSKKIENKMYRYWKKTAFHPVDIEFKIVGEKRELYIKQVRPFND
ncbi:MAG: PEP/pyruvate-binding domain-containing protein [Phycisphaerales bacterium]